MFASTRKRSIPGELQSNTARKSESRTIQQSTGNTGSNATAHQKKSSYPSSAVSSRIERLEKSLLNSRYNDGTNSEEDDDDDDTIAPTQNKSKNSKPIYSQLQANKIMNNKKQFIQKNNEPDDDSEDVSAPSLRRKGPSGGGRRAWDKKILPSDSEEEDFARFSKSKAQMKNNNENPFSSEKGEAATHSLSEKLNSANTMNTVGVPKISPTSLDDTQAFTIQPIELSENIFENCDKYQKQHEQILERHNRIWYKRVQQAHTEGHTKLNKPPSKSVLGQNFEFWTKNR